MKTARAYKRFDGWYFQAISVTTVGVGIGTPPRIRCEITAGLDALGQAVLDALNGSRQGVPHPAPEESEHMFKPMLDLAGVKTWAAFAKQTRSAAICLDGEWLSITPWKNLGARGGFAPFSDTVVRVPISSSAALIGEALENAISLSLP